MSCPQPKTLQQLLDEALPADQQQAVQTHLENCASCQQTLERLVAGGVTWDKAAENLAEPATRDETAMLDAVVKLQNVPTSASQTRVESPSVPSDEDLSFLQPSQRPGSLGRLDDYEILSVVGKGGFGIVLKAFDETLHRVVAVKVMLPQMAASGTARARFVKEAKAAAAITHDNIVTIHAVKKDATIPYLAMQFVSGLTLNEKIEQAGSLSVKEILRIAMQIAEGLAAAHKQGLVHRDIKPGNILLENGVERVKITDFGLARAVDDASVTQSGMVAGTPMYMSPEQANGEAVDHRSDLFSLGSVLYVMCTGRPPFRATSTMAVLKRVCDDTPTPIREVNAEIPDWLCDIVAKLHAKKPSERFQTATEVAELLGQHLAQVQRPGTVPPAAQTQPRPRNGLVETGTWPVWPIALVGILLAALAPVFLYFLGPAAIGVIGIIAIGYLVALYLWLRAGSLESDGRTRRHSRSTILPVALVGLFVLLVAVVFLFLLHAKHGEMPFAHWGLGPVLMVVVLEALCGLWLYVRLRSQPRTTAASTPVAHAPGSPRRRRWVYATVAVLGLIILAGAIAPFLLRPWFIGPPGPRTDLTIFSDDPDLEFEVQGFSHGHHWKEPYKGRGVAGGIAHGFGVDPGEWEVRGFKQGKLVRRERFTLAAREWKKIQWNLADEIWAPLFNGKDLTGWKPSPADKDVWRVKDGILIGQGAECSLLPSERRDFRDFHLRVEAKINEGGNSGVWLRTDLHSQDGYEVNINHSHRDPARTGSLGFKKNHIQKWLHDQKNSPVPANTWFTLEVIAAGPNFTVKVDGLTVAQVTDANRSAGHFGLEAFEKNTVVHFRKIEIKELPPEEPGWVQLFNGKDLDGWNQPLGRGEWKVINGVLTGSTKRGDFGILPTLREYGSFHLRTQVRLTGPGNSGILFRTEDGYEAEIDTGTTGSIARAKPFAWLEKKQHALVKPGSWCDLELIADGPKLTTKVNGHVVANVTDASVARSFVGLQVDGRDQGAVVVEFRKIEIKELPPDNTPLSAVAPFDAKKAKEHQDAWARHLGVETEITNTIGMKLRMIPPGEYMMGSSPEEIAWLLKEIPDLKDASDNVRSEGPQRRVILKEPFYMGVHEVTVGHFREFVRATKHRTEAETGQGGIVWNNDVKKWERKPEYVWDNAKLYGGDTHPVVFVTLADAQAFCSWLTKQEGRAYAVPAEEQWEWACRAGATTRWFFGNDPVAMKDFGWTTPRSEGKLKPVGHLAPNPFGLYDIYGNANELTMNLQQQAVGRGGEAGESPHRARSASRFVIDKQYDPSYRRGFRVAIVGNLKAKTPPAEPWIQLFNGSDLTGWQTDKPDQWKVQNGAIVGRGGKGYLVLTGKQFEDFHCRLEAKINADSWGGLAFRHSAESHGNVSICPKLGKTGSLFYFNKGKNQLLQEPQKQLAAPDTWLNLELIVQGKNVVVLVNGTKTAAASIDGLPDRGPIELCADAPGTVIHFRKIEIKELVGKLK